VAVSPSVQSITTVPLSTLMPVSTPFFASSSVNGVPSVVFCLSVSSYMITPLMYLFQSPGAVKSSSR